jgi:modulator of FtsH protease
MYMQQPSRSLYGGPRAASGPALLGQVLGITSAGFLITSVAVYLANAIFGGVSGTVGLVALIAGFVLLFAINGVRANQGLALLLFYAFTFLEGIGLTPVISMYARSIGWGVVFEAALTTGIGMAVLGLAAFAFSFDWRRLSGIAFGCLIGLIIVGLISAFTHWIHPETYSYLTLGVFSLLVLIDFSRIRAGGDGLTAVQIATSIYLDAINIFLALLQLFGMRGSRDD